MLWLGLALPIIYIPGYLGMTIPTSWVLLSCVLPLTLWRPITLTGFHWVLFAFVAVSIASITWSWNVFDAVWGTWIIILFSLAFILGSTERNLHPFFLGLGIGLTLNSFLAYAQALGYNPVLANHYLSSQNGVEFYNISGLMYNSMLFGEVLALGILGLVVYRLWIFIPFLLVALYLSHSIGGWLALAVGLLALITRSIGVMSLFALASATAISFLHRPSDAERLSAWYTAITNLSVFGHGPGSFLSIFYFQDPILFPGHVHNDFLQLAFEYGIFAIIPLALLLGLAVSTSSREWPIYIAFLFMCAFSFPLYSPITSTLGALCAGRISRTWALDWDIRNLRRHRFLLWLRHPQPIHDLTRSKALPLV